MAFVAGTIVATMPYVEAAGGWKEAFDQLFSKITALENKVNSLEENTVNCKNEYLIKGALHNNYELSPICESQLTPLSIDAGTDKSATGVYISTVLPNEEQPDEPPAVLYEAHCSITSDGSVGGSYLRYVIVHSIATSNDGIYDIDVLKDSGLGGIGLTHSILDSLPAPIGMVAYALDSPEIPTPIPTAEEVIGTFTVEYNIEVRDWFSNVITSDTVTYTCHP